MSEKSSLLLRKRIQSNEKKEITTSLLYWIIDANTVVSNMDQEPIRILILTCRWFLTVGILPGSWWAHHELGRGGWWFRDPVENASFMPRKPIDNNSTLNKKLRITLVFWNEINETFIDVEPSCTTKILEQSSIHECGNHDEEEEPCTQYAL
ncbi:cytochrome c assembly protein [Cynara cardunculus var. scolymus]|uniref:Cytochrome c assembly protein n=1 Tax=Cynara cardunculus var. scolymus TaxID=59895 RepID=A0A103Y5Y8_CYNCS|nr:cytochrome c assembly protein [Cynara cardunculus var. scolymus]